ncbi:MAG: TIGR04222 domain-containing membrane protein [Luteolibacter sp.]
MKISEIPFFDLNGPAFLAFYAILFGIATVWSFLRARSAANRFDRAGYYPELTDPYDTAYLAGGAPRASQLAALRLMHSGHIQWKSRYNGNFLLLLKPANGDGLHVIERKMLRAIQQGDKSGLSVPEAYTAVLPTIRGLEVRLASLGLRPTEQERTKAGWSAVVPLLVLLGIGLIKLAIGLSRDKPVGFLIIFLTVSLILAIVVGRNTRRLTKTGDELLNRLRSEKNPPQRDSSFDGVFWNFALLGPAVLASIPEFAAIYKGLTRQMGGPANNGSSSGCGTSGCSSASSGCGGGGGCGGCGGGGD